MSRNISQVTRTSVLITTGMMMVISINIVLVDIGFDGSVFNGDGNCDSGDSGGAL